MSRSRTFYWKVGLVLAAAPLWISGCLSSAAKPAAPTQPGNAASALPGPSTPGVTAPAALNYPADSEWIYKLATLDDVQASITNNSPPEATITVRGLLPDGATRINDIKVQQLPGGVFLTITTARPRKAVATLALVPFERTVTVDLRGVPKGECRITANELATTVMVP